MGSGLSPIYAGSWRWECKSVPAGHNIPPEVGGSRGAIASPALELVRVAALSGYTTVAHSLGLNYRSLLKEAGLTASLLDHPEQLISAGAAIHLLEESAKLTCCPTFGLKMALQRDVSDMGMVSVLMALQPSLGDVIRVVDYYRGLVLPIVALNVERHNDIAVIVLDLTLSAPQSHRQANELLLGITALAARAVLGEFWMPQCTHFAYPKPATNDLPVYQRMFRGDLEFNATFNGLTVTRADLDTPRTTANIGLAHHAESLVLDALHPARQSIVLTVQETIMHLLSSSQATLKTTAHALGLNERTLQRRLDGEGFSFQDLLNKTRRQLAARLLANRDAKLAEVAEALGYSSTSSFSRWYHGTFGHPPRGRR
jgi:AraC-like DNA-binding protein